MKQILIFLVLILASVWHSAGAGEIVVKQWLFSGVFELTMPAFSEKKNIKGKVFEPADLFAFDPKDISDLFPSKGDTFEWSTKRSGKWEIVKSGDDGFAVLSKSSGGSYLTGYMAFYLETGRWTKGTLELSSRFPFEVFIEGQKSGSKTTTEKEGESTGKWSEELKLKTGKHLVMVRCFYPGKGENGWSLKGTFRPADFVNTETIETTLSPVRGKTINDVLDGLRPGSATLSPDGEKYAISYSRTLPPDGNRESWTEIKRVSDGSIIQSFRHGNISSLEWAPEGHRFFFMTTRQGSSFLWVYDLEKGSYRPVLERIEDMGSYKLTPDGKKVIFTISEEADDDSGDLYRVHGMRDRIPGFRRRSFLYIADVETGVRKRLTHGNLTTSLHDISPDSRSIIFSQSWPDYRERPFSKQNVYIMDLVTKEVDTIFSELRWGVSAAFSPDGSKLLMTGGPSAFGSTGENVPDDKIANNYDTQAYIYDIETGHIDPITLEFDPSVSQVLWNRADNRIYLVAQEEDYQRLYTYNPGNRRFAKIETGVDMTSRFSPAGNALKAVYTGSSITTPPAVYIMNLQNNRHEILENPEEDNYRDVRFGDTEDWNFTTGDGTTVKGRIYYPPDFDKSEKYPLLVYYYGGTTPVTRSFGGRYPFNLYAANGYVVYVLQPSGAIGFGQEFSARHVNNWGKTVAGEIIEGTKKFLDAHPFIERKSVGCLGASYGGFMTMLLLTQTDLFSAAMSHAGISNIASYWGEGYWGYGYSAEASAGSYPWNNRELYVDQSPLYNADKITTPLLMLHGDSDTNVPPGESIQMYVALKILGRPVELVKVADEDHHILKYDRRIDWNNAILGWFDKWLKNEPQWWGEQYPEKNL